MSTWTILGGDNTCPTCNAAPGQPCTSRNNKPLTSSHVARYRDQQTDTCQHCGHRIIPGHSHNGWVHETTRRARCDTRRVQDAGKATAPQAAPTPAVPSRPALDDIRARQHDDLRLASDHQLEAYLAEVTVAQALRDRLPRTAVELLHLARAQKGAA